MTTFIKEFIKRQREIEDKAALGPYQQYGSYASSKNECSDVTFTGMAYNQQLSKNCDLYCNMRNNYAKLLSALEVMADAFIMIKQNTNGIDEDRECNKALNKVEQILKGE